MLDADPVILIKLKRVKSKILSTFKIESILFDQLLVERLDFAVQRSVILVIVVR